MSSRTLLLIVLCLGFACASRAVGAATADSAPTADEVEKFIATSLPGYWKVDQLNLSDAVDYGNSVEPEWRWRYEAVLAPKEPLYLKSGRHEGVVLLELNLGPESLQTLYGVVLATFYAGRWSGEARHENRPFDHGGQPASFFPGRTVVVGSPEERELRDATQRRVLEKLEATHKAESAALKIEQQAALASAKDTNRTALASLKAEHDAERERREAEHQNELARAAAQHAEQRASLEADLKAEAERRRVEITESEKLIELTAEASRRLTALHAAEAEMLAGSERVHEARRVALKKLFDMLGVVTGPDDYLVLLDTAGESGLEWMRVAALRHGLGSDDLALSRIAWRHLLRADIKSNPDLRSLLADHAVNLKDHPDLRNLLASHVVTVHQWASRAVDSSSYFSAEFSPEWALGQPSRVECNSQERNTHWATKRPDDGMHFIRVAFAKSVLLPQIEIHESSHGGFVRKLILSDGKGNDTEYEVKDDLNQCPGVSVFRMDEHAGPVAEVAVIIDTQHQKGNWERIDAIALIGVPLE